MNELPYLIAIALVEQGNKRIMPIGGRSLKNFIDTNDFPNETASLISLELLVRLLQRSEEQSIRRAAEENSFLIAQIPIEAIQNQIPLLKREWILSGDTEKLILEMNILAKGLWFLNFVRYEGIKFVRCL